MYPDMEIGGVGFEREEIVEGGEMAVRMGAKKLFCGDEVGEKNLFAFMEETWLTGWGEPVKERKKSKDVSEMEF